MKKITLFIMIILSLFSLFSLGNSGNTNYYSEIVIDSKTNRVLYENNAHQKRYPASTTKILTAICVIENCNVDDIVEVSKETVGVEGSSIYLEVGEKISVKELLYGLMLRSGNDCAETLAVYCSKSIEKFAELMNKTAQKAGAINSNFCNPHGLHDDNHYTTAYDLALISSYAMKNEVFREIVATKNVDISFSTRNYKRKLKNKNKMLFNYEGANGIKTGYTKKAGRCLVSSSIKNGMQLISVVLNCQPMWDESTRILNYCYDKYKYEFLVDSKNIVDFVDIFKTTEKCPLYIKNDIVLPLTNEEKENIKIEYDYPSILYKPIEKDENIGSIKIYCKNNLIFTEKIYTILKID